MNNPAVKSKPAALSNYLNIIIAFVVVSIIGIIIIPMPPFILDILLVVNISLSITILVLTLFTHSVLEFLSFPTLLLVTTMIRLGLNISSTRLILSIGDAGSVIETFGSFVAGDNYIVGAVLFIIIVIVQILVVTNGASRVAEVSARFTLDAMPGKQMAIDADLNSGLITEELAKSRRSNLEKEANFYGAMDGASKFVKGDAIAGIIITLINLIGGIAIHSLQGSYTIGKALNHFGQLTIGDGLVSQIPSLLISVASGILVTRTANEKGFGDTIGGELFHTPQVMYIVATLLAIFALVPGFPFFPFILLATGLVVAGYLVGESQKTTAEEEMDSQRQAAMKQESGPVEETASQFQVDRIAVELGYGLIPLASEEQESNLTSQIAAIRKQLSYEMGILLNPIRIRDNLQMSQYDYVIKIKGNQVASGTLYPDKFLVVEPGGIEDEIEGIDAKEPAFGLDALWVNDRNKEIAELNDYTVVDPLTVLVTHVKEMMKTNADELLGRQEVKELLEGLKEDYNVVIEELIPDILQLGDVQKVLQRLLREYVPITDLVTILETLADYGNTTKDHETLTEYVRQSLKRTIVREHIDNQGTLNVLAVHPDVEERVSSSIQKSTQGSIPVLQPQEVNRLFDSITQQSTMLSAQGIPFVLLTAPKIRPAVKNLLSFNFPELAVLSLNEIPNDSVIESVGTVTMT
ncbi:flagellar biosynthesis protein FlhA [Alkalibacterium putridalgicola]|uniref:Flagellar biosynthesis protein FlhA n=1 Tax=Alkalibacterium putridalgicola TaxID=426703 RepID=A0A1H7T7L0_9LACT|nr:flagellar biosynthesis protein FlhA [Alkalibacterium putridalgicola]GEK89341.1 flagellar biosynthesis protein FlhA [Alkalibacterium putridalgicola]SEL80266.1 flagellar biosynthesis protein FlhA [Alkalibacterium putridalgicola]